MSDIPTDIVGRAAVDESFRRELLADPAAANEAHSLGLTDDQIAAIVELDGSATEVAVPGGTT